MRLPIYQVDAFTDKLFGGNPAAICPLDTWLPDATMQAIAAENNLSETAFLVRDGGDYALRWFTPAVEVDLCGHATLASGHVVMSLLEPQRQSVSFRTAKAGTLVVARRADMLVMDFPAWPAVPLKRRRVCSQHWAVSRAKCCAPAIISSSTTARRRLRHSSPILPRLRS